MSRGVTLKLNSKFIELLDKYRGDLSRDDFILRIIDEHLKNKERINFSKYNLSNQSKDTEPSDLDLVAFMEDFKEFANSIYNRLDRLEDILNSQKISPKIKTGDISKLEGFDYLSDDDRQTKYSEDTKFQVTGDDDKPMIFEVLDSEDDVDDLGSVKTKYNAYEKNGDEFEYGCPFCNATIDKNAKECSQCGNKFDEEILIPDDAVIVEPLPNQYKDAGEYDPRPMHIKYGTTFEEEQFESYQTQPEIHGSALHLCSICGANMVFIDDYKRWYCKSCKRYAGATIISHKKPGESIDKPTKIEEPKPRPAKRKHKPLKDYHMYTD